MTPHASGQRWTLCRADYRDTLAAVADSGGCDLVATSPPYGDSRTYGNAVSWTDTDYAALGDAVFAALKPGGHALINVDAPVREWRPGFGTERGFHPWRLMLDWAERVGFRVPDRLVFGRDASPGLFPGRFRSGWEPLLWFVRPGGPSFFDSKSIARGAICAEKHKRKGEYRKGSRDTVRMKDTFWDNPGWRYPTTLWDYGTVSPMAEPTAGQNHPARWPYRLAEDIIRCFCPPDGLVCDPFTGAGTTAAASIAHGRRFVGGDLFARQEDGVPWVEVAAGILRDRERQVPLFAPAVAVEPEAVQGSLFGEKP